MIVSEANLHECEEANITCNNQHLSLNDSDRIHDSKPRHLNQYDC